MDYVLAPFLWLIGVLVSIVFWIVTQVLWILLWLILPLLVIAFVVLRIAERGAGGWVPIAGLDLPALAALASHGLVDLAGEHARLGRAVQEVLDGLTRALCDAPFAPPEAA